MALDLFVTFTGKAHRPSCAEVYDVVQEHFLGLGRILPKFSSLRPDGSHKRIYDGCGRICVRLPGNNADAREPWRSIYREDPFPRVVDVYCHGRDPLRLTSVDVCTRDADTITKSIQRGLADLLVRLWDGRCPELREQNLRRRRPQHR